ncbi:MAG: apolipoprotein N-acyltransferase [bacterium]
MKYGKYGLAALTGVLLFFAFENFLGVNLWPLAWAALVPLLYALHKCDNKKQAALTGAVTGLAGYPLFYHWLVYTMNTYGQMSVPVSVLVLVALVALLTLFLAGFGVFYYYAVQRGGFSPLLAAPVGWTVLELIRARFPFGGFPWGFLANSQYKFIHLIQPAEITGPYGITFIIVLFNASILAVVLNLEKRRKKEKLYLKRVAAPLLVGIGVPLLAVAYGAVRIPMVDLAFENQPAVKVGIIQPNIDQAIKWDNSYFWRIMRNQMRLTEKVSKEAPRLVIWPEAAIPVGNFNLHWEERDHLVRFLSEIETYLLVGGISMEKCDSGPRGMCSFNSAYLISPNAEKLVGRYDKIRLVPFSEYVPLAELFFFAEAISQGHVGSTTPGKEIKTMSVPGMEAGCVICYELVFPHLVRKFPDQGANVMTTITNDAWFGRTGAPYQHHANAVLRAVENRVYFARAANTGISSIVGPAGRIKHQTPIYEKTAFTGIVKPSPLKTFYSACGDVFGWIAAIALLAMAATPAYRERVHRI